VRRPSRDDERLAFEQLFRETRQDLLAYLVRRSPRAEDAADTLAETYLVAWRRLDAIPQGDAARLWLFGVARNLLRKGTTRHRVQGALVERLARELQSSALEPVDDARADALRAAVAALPARQREVVLLTAWEGLTPKQVAMVTGTPVNVVRVRLHRARNRLKHELEIELRAARVRSCLRTSAASATRAGRA
jgi:RNA polymerase sigma factor (sigma-70 family)